MKEKLIEMTIDMLKKMEGAEFPNLAVEIEKEITKLLPSYDFSEFREKIVEYLVLMEITSLSKIKVLSIATISNPKVLNYLDVQIYKNILKCIYDLMNKASETLSMETFSKKMKIGVKTCNVLYPEKNFEEALEILTDDLNTWIAYNEMIAFCSIEKCEDGIYVKVTI